MQWRISAIFSKIKHEKPRIRGIIFIGSRRKLAFIRIQMNRIKGFEEADIMLKHFLYDSSLSQLNGLYTPFVSPVPGGQKPQRGTNGRCSTLVEESNGVQAAVNDR